jgi:hypothetical protein
MPEGPFPDHGQDGDEPDGSQPQPADRNGPETRGPAPAAKLVLKLDPESAERRKQARRKNDAHVRPFREDSGNAGMVARELPSDEVLASWQHVEQRALDLRAAGVPGSLRELRIRAYLDLLPGPGVAALAARTGRSEMADPGRAHLHHHPLRVLALARQEPRRAGPHPSAIE